MAIEQLTIFQKIYDFMVYLHPLVSRFPKNQRFVLGQIIEKEAANMLKLTIQANKRRGIDRQNFQEGISDSLDVTRILFRLSCDLKFISVKQYGIGVERLNEIGKMLAGWSKFSAEKPQTSLKL